MTVNLIGPIVTGQKWRLWLCESGSNESVSSTNLSGQGELADLTEQERQRWMRFRPLKKRQQFLFSRAVVRSVLLHEFGDTARGLQLSAEANGRPVVRDSAGRRTGYISLSHSANVVAVATSDETDVGVDVEILPPTRPGKQRILGVFDRERILLEQALGLNPHLAIVTAWTIKEATWKCFGGDPAITANQISIEQTDGQIFAQICSPTSVVQRFSLYIFESLHPAEIGSPQNVNLHNLRRFGTEFVGCVALRTGQPP